MNMRSPTQTKAESSFTPVQAGLLQRKCAACSQHTIGAGECGEYQKKRSPLQRRATNQAEPYEVPPIVGEVLRSPGQPLDPHTRNFMESGFGHDFSQVRVHTNLKANESAQAVNAKAYTVGRNVVFSAGQYAPETSVGKRLLAHELTHVVQQDRLTVNHHGLTLGSPSDRSEQEADAIANRIFRGEAIGNNQEFTSPVVQVVQRDLALEPPAEVPEQPDLTDAQVQAAIRYNRVSYGEESTRLIQDLVGVEQTGTFDEATVWAVAQIQRDFGLRADGRVGANTYDLLIRELQAEGTAPGSCLTLFQIVGPEPLRFFRSTTNPHQGTIGSRFRIRARFDPRCNCADFEYRQFIDGNVELRDHTGATFNLNADFAVPGGLPNTMGEDGDTTIPVGVAGHHYGHRFDSDNPTDNRDRYLPDRRTGCEYAGHDFPELGPIPATPGDRGDLYDWTMRFRGVIRRRGHGVVEEKFWAIRGTVSVP